MALVLLCNANADSNVLSRLLELLEIICTRLARSDGLVYEEYSAGSGGAQWNAAGGTINYGESEACGMSHAVCAHWRHACINFRVPPH